MKSVEKIKRLFAQSDVTVSNKVDDRILDDALTALDESKKTKSTPDTYEPNIRRIILWRKVGYLAAAFLVISSLAVSFFLYREVTDLRNELEQARRDIAVAPTDDTATINLYL